jgi:hypothetical protein
MPIPPESATQIDVTECLSPYREAVRHLWNTLFAASGLTDFDTVEEFAEIDDRLFNAVVVPRVIALGGRASDGGEPESQRAVSSESARALRCGCVLSGLRDSLRVVPSISWGTPVMIENPREGDGNHYWDHPISEVRPEQVELKYLAYFNWDQLGIRDYRYYMVEVARLADHPELFGRRALIEVGHAIVTVSREPDAEPPV